MGVRKQLSKRPAPDGAILRVSPNSAELSLEQDFVKAANLVMVAVTTVVVLGCVLLHYEVLRGYTELLRRIAIQPRRRILVLILGIIVLHVVEIWIFGLAYYLLMQNPEQGTMASATALLDVADLALLDYVYYSAVVYTTLGFGDLVPLGPIRYMTGTEAVTGLVLITWSASFTFLEMQRFWKA